MIVLGLDASSDAAAVGLMADGRLLCEYTLNNGKNHSIGGQRKADSRIRAFIRCRFFLFQRRDNSFKVLLLIVLIYFLNPLTMSAIVKYLKENI